LSIRPSTRFASRLAAPGLGGDFEPVGVDISVPEGYSMQILQGTVNFRRRNLDPAIQLYSQGGNDRQVIDSSGFTTKECGGGDEHLANVWLLACVEIDPAVARLAPTFGVAECPDLSVQLVRRMLPLSADALDHLRKLALTRPR
jgi:hypothetical protein